MKKQYKISILISFIVMIIVIGNIIRLNYFKNEKIYVATEGILDATNWDVGKEGNIKLDGVWEFYPGVFLKPGETKNDDFKKYQNIKKYIDVPGSWQGYLDHKGTSEGAGTYRLIIKVPEDGIYCMKTTTIRLASKIYLNGHEVIRTGNPSLNKEEIERESKYKIGVGNSSDKEIEIIAHISSYEYKSGGIIKSIEFGSFESIIKEDNRSRALYTIAISVCLVLGVYFTIVYFQRSKELYLLYFGGASLFMGLHLSTMNEQILDLIYNYDFVTRTRIQVVAMLATSIFLLQFTHKLFSKYSNKKFVKIITIINIIPLLLFIFGDADKLPKVIKTINEIMVLVGYNISYINIFYTLLKLIYHKVELLEYIFIITVSMSLYWLINTLKMFLEINIGNTPVMLILMMLGGAATLMSHRLQLDFKNVNDLSEKLIRYDRLKDEFLARASHELRTPLHIIFNLTKGLLEGNKGTLNSKQQEDLFFIHQEGKRLIRLITDLLDASQIKKGDIKLRLELIKPNEMIEGILKEMKILIPKDKHIELKNQIPVNFEGIKCDSDKFRQIIYNLVHNAIKFTNSGDIVVSAIKRESQVEITVSDTGIGVEEIYFKEIFDTFYQKNEKNQTNVGLGLGLSIAKHMVEIHGGDMWIESIYGKGSSFKFTLPLYEESIIEKQDYIGVSTYKDKPVILERKIDKNTGKPMILIVDDKVLNQKVLVDILDELELNTILADNGKEALNIINNNKIDLIILDFVLPDISGDELCKKIREQYSMVELPILILTASGRLNDLMSAFDYGANDFQRKPIEPSELISRVQSLLLMKKSVEDSLKKEFQFFYSQISPHFLYNTINTIIGLSYMDSEKTRKALNNLSIYFRSKLDVHSKKHLVSLESELDLIIAYLEIEQMRYGDKLKIEYDIDENIHAMIPPLTLQPIVENAVHHGIASKNSRGKIKIVIKKGNKGYIDIVVEDDGIGMTLEKQEELLRGNTKRIGFENVVQKISKMNGAKVVLESNIGKGTKVYIVIPEG